MILNKILNNVEYELIKGNIDINIKEICYDSRKVEQDFLFICLVGSTSDGHNFIEKAISDGATCIVVSKDVKVDENITVIKVDDTRRVLSKLAINFYDNPISKLTSVALTGTKGKTTSACLIKNILEEDGKKTGLIGTMGVFYNDVHYDTVNTTPESLEIQKYLSEMVNNGIKYVVMEVSSQALKVGRVDGIVFDYGIFTNLSKDHIGPNEHDSMEDYIYSKSLLFRICKNGIFNIDDKYYDDMIKDSNCDINTFGYDDKANLVIKNTNLYRSNHVLGIEMSTGGIINDKFIINSPGKFSAYNSACAILTTKLMGCSIESIRRSLLKVFVKGRMEIIEVSPKYSVIIDYAHNGVSIENVLETIKEYKPNRIISLFGCGGNRSRDRRYDMGEVSGKYSDLTVITEDNSRLEDINDIMNDIEIGVNKSHGKYIKIADRTEAIKYVLNNARSGDIILLLGKGHETYMDKNGKKFHYDEREVIKNIINYN